MLSVLKEITMAALKKAEATATSYKNIHNSDLGLGQLIHYDYTCVIVFICGAKFSDSSWYVHVIHTELNVLLYLLARR